MPVVIEAVSLDKYITWLNSNFPPSFALSPNFINSRLHKLSREKRSVSAIQYRFIRRKRVLRILLPTFLTIIILPHSTLVTIVSCYSSRVERATVNGQMV